MNPLDPLNDVRLRMPRTYVQPVWPPLDLVLYAEELNLARAERVLAECSLEIRLVPEEPRRRVEETMRMI